MANQKFKGVACLWAVSSTSVVPMTGSFMQNRDHTLKSEKDLIKDASGTTVGKIYYDFNEEATFEFVLSQAGSATGSFTPGLTNVGDTITIVDTVYTQISGANWTVDEVSTKTSNTGKAMATVQVSRYLGMPTP